MNDDLKVLVVDDSVTYRYILSEVVLNINGVKLVGNAINGKRALDKIPLSKPDIVLLDVAMPVMDGLETLENIKKLYPDIEVIMISGMNLENASITMDALNNGALDFIPKPNTISADENKKILKSALSPLMSLIKTRILSRLTRKISSDTKETKSPVLKNRISISSKRNRPLPELSTRASKEARSLKESRPLKETKALLKSNLLKSKRVIPQIKVVALGVSTGGPNALQEIIPKLNSDFPLPIIAVQHMPPLFTATLAERLDSMSLITVVEAKENQEVKKGHMYLAPGGSHMIIRKNYQGIKIGITDSPPVNSCKPSVDVLFTSIGMVYKGNVLTVILTGMGSDGASSVASIRRKGGYSIVQDQNTSVVWGMPGAVANAGNADEILSLDTIAQRITQIAERYGV